MFSLHADERLRVLSHIYTVLILLQTIADAITVTLPYVAKKLFDSVATIISSLKNFLTNPVQSVTVFGKSVLE